jgi:predicted DNA-binding transcriptional regulator AlpA
VSEPIHIISLGAGVQSSTLALLAARGKVTPMPVGAIFADTGGEPPSVYQWLDWLETQLPFPVHRVSAGSLEEAEMVVRRSKRSGKVYRRSLIPSFADGAGGVFPRKCTRDFKLFPIFRKVKELAQVPRQRRTGVYATQWIGISTDEAHRMKESFEAWKTHRYPLIELGMSRAQCLAWMTANGYPQPPRSACVYCPYHSDAEWIRLRDQEPEAFAAAVTFERRMQAAAQHDEVARHLPFLHSARVPLDTVVFDPGKPDRQLNLFGNECEGMCGV